MAPLNIYARQNSGLEEQALISAVAVGEKVMTDIFSSLPPILDFS